MMKLFSRSILGLCLISAPLFAEDVTTIRFDPPKGWQLANHEDLPQSVKIMVVGKGKREFPPSLNLSTETYPGTLKDYLKIVQDINASKGTAWKDLGTIHTEAGDASLSQVESETQWGDVRLMHVILVKNGTAYILTAAALNEEFPHYYKDFFSSLRSLRFEE